MAGWRSASDGTALVSRLGYSCDDRDRIVSPDRRQPNGVKLFGPGGFPANRFQKGLRMLFPLDDEEWGDDRALVLVLQNFSV